MYWGVGKPVQARQLCADFSGSVGALPPPGAHPGAARLRLAFARAWELQEVVLKIWMLCKKCKKFFLICIWYYVRLYTYINVLYKNVVCENQRDDILSFLVVLGYKPTVCWQGAATGCLAKLLWGKATWCLDRAEKCPLHRTGWGQARPGDISSWSCSCTWLALCSILPWTCLSFKILKMPSCKPGWSWISINVPREVIKKLCNCGARGTNMWW